MKRSQISMFIIAGLITLMIIVGLVYLIQNMQEKNLSRQAEFLPMSELKYHITLCVENTGSYALLKLGLQGGMIGLKEPYLHDSALKVDYAYDNNISFASLERMGQELSSFVDGNLRDCVYRYVENRKRDYEIVFGNISTTTLIGEDDVTFDVHFPVEVIQNKTINRYDSFISKIPVRLKRVHRLVENLLNRSIETGFPVHHDCFYDPLMNLYVLDYGQSTLYIIEDTGSNYKNIESKRGPYRFLFAVKN